MITMLAIQAAAMLPVPSAPPAPPAPPPIVRTYSEPIVTTTEIVDRAAPGQVSEVEIVIRSPSGPLWQGTLRVAERGGESSWAQTRSEPPRAACPSRGYYWNGEREMLSLTLSPASRELPGSLVVQVRWARRGDGMCDGLRTVELRQTVAVAARQTAVVTGDGGLRVELRRR